MTSPVSRCALMVAFAAVAPAARAQTLDLYILAGQSNMLGWGYTAELELPFAARQSDVLYHSVQGEGFGFLRPTGRRFGPELSFGRTMGDESEPRIAILKHAVGGSSLAFDWRPQSGALYQELLESVAACEDYWASAGYESRVAGIVWSQGEADARVFAMASAYETNMQEFIASLRADLNAPEAPFVFNQIQGTRFHFRDIIREAQANIDDLVAGAYLIGTDDLTTFEGVHFDSASQLELGRRLGTAMLGARSSIDGDVNADGVVDLRDLNAVRSNFAGSGTGDATRDGRINLDDLNLVRNQFGVQRSAAVPEPTNAALVILSGATMACLRRRVIATNSARNRASRLGSWRSRCLCTGRSC